MPKLQTGKTPINGLEIAESTNEDRVINVNELFEGEEIITIGEMLQERSGISLDKNAVRKFVDDFFSHKYFNSSRSGFRLDQPFKKLPTKDDVFTAIKNKFSNISIIWGGEFAGTLVPGNRGDALLVLSGKPSSKILSDLTEGVVGGLVFNSRRDEQPYRKGLFQKMTEFKNRELADSEDDLEEELATNVAGGDPNPNIAGFDQPPVMKRKCLDKFAGSKVFEVDGETFSKSIQGKPKFARFKNFMSLEDFPNVGEEIREYSRKNPRENIVLKNKSTGHMVYLKGFKE